MSATEEVLDAVGVLVMQQIKDRFRTNGASGGVNWPGKVNKDDQGNILGGMYDSFHHKVSARQGKLTIYSDDNHFFVHQLGTKGKGGTLPTIVPKQAKALFIPLTKRARTSSRITGQPAMQVRKERGMTRAVGPMRMAVQGPKGKSGHFSPLKQGKVINGAMHVRNRHGKWVPGKADFIFSRKVDIPPRPMVPNSKKEQETVEELVTELMNPNNRPLV